MSELLKKVVHGKPHVHVGKNGVSQQVLKQIKELIEKKKIIKIKFLTFGEFESVQEAASFLQLKTNSRVVDIRGKSIVMQQNSF